MKNNNDCVALVCGYISKEALIEQNIVKNFFHNIWSVHTNKLDSEKTLLKIIKCSIPKHDEISSVTYLDNNEHMFDKDRSKVKLKIIEILKS